MALSGDGSRSGFPLKLALVVAVFTLIGVFFSGQVWVDYGYAGRRLSWPKALAVALVDWYLWALLTPVVHWLAFRFRPARGRWILPFAVHGGASVVLGGVKIVAESMATRAIVGPGRAPFSFLKIHLTLLTYGAIVGVVYAIDHYRKLRDRELQASRLEAQLARAQVQALKTQLHPHFLFNTLNAIAGLMREDVEAADVMIARLSELLRITLDSASVQEVTLEQELDFLDRYLQIQQMRFGDRLEIRLEVAPEARELLVPNLILQPLVENALRHGVGARPGPGHVELVARVLRGFLHLEIRDDGPGPPVHLAEGHGLRNTKARLRGLCGPDATFTLAPRPGGGAVVEVVLPAREETTAASESP